MVKKIINSVFNLDYEKNFEETVNILEKKILLPALMEIIEIN